MKMIKTIGFSGISSYMPYSENAIEALQTTNKYGTANQQMTVQHVDVIFDKSGGVVSEEVLESIFTLPNQRNSNHSNKEIELSEKEVELQIREERLRKAESALLIKEEKIQNKRVNA